MGRQGILHHTTTAEATAALGVHEGIGLDVLGVGVFEDEGRQGSAFNLLQGGRVKALVLIPEPVAIAQGFKLLADDQAKRLTHHRSRQMGLRQAADPQFHLVHIAIGRLQGRGRGGIGADRLKTGVGLQP